MTRKYYEFSYMRWSAYRTHPVSNDISTVKQRLLQGRSTSIQFH